MWNLDRARDQAHIHYKEEKERNLETKQDTDYLITWKLTNSSYKARLTKYQWSGKDTFRANSLYVKLFKDHIGEDARHRPKHLAPSRSSLCVEL